MSLVTIGQSQNIFALCHFLVHERENAVGEHHYFLIPKVTQCCCIFAVASYRGIRGLSERTTLFRHTGSVTWW